jgi:hypothetical protein
MIFFQQYFFATFAEILLSRSTSSKKDNVAQTQPEPDNAATHKAAAMAQGDDESWLS